VRREVRGVGARDAGRAWDARREAQSVGREGAQGELCVCVSVCVCELCVCWFVCARAGQGKAGRRRAASGVGEIGDEERRW